MKTIFLRFYNPDEVMDVTAETTDEEIKKSCFKVCKYKTEFDALTAYANTPATWSTLLDESENIEEWIDDAYEHVKSNDFDWLEGNFV